LELKMKSHLSPARQTLLEIIDSLGFGVIENLAIVRGDPYFDPLPKILQDIKIGTDAAPQTERSNDDFVLKSKIVELFQHLDQLDRVRVTIEIKHSQPFRIVVERTAGEAIERSARCLR
jgi:hypothetical protein